jgi:hypothetical protein
MSTITHNRFWRVLTLLVRLDMAALLASTAALCIWLALH